MDGADVEEVEKNDVEAKGGGGGLGRNFFALEATGILTQDAEPCSTTLVDDYNGFNELSLLTMIRTVRHCWPAGTRFAFN